MLKVDTFEEMDALLEKARAKAEKLQPEVVLIEFGEYKVVRSLGGFYTIQAGEDDFGQVWIGCQCKGSAKNACYHMARVWPLHKQLYFASDAPRTGKLPEQNEIPYLKSTSGKKPEIVGNIRI